jgi:hypothetical protein
MGIETIGTREERQHQRASELIPWYVNGSLADAERRAVEEHADACPRCRQELAGEAELARAIQAAETAAPSPHPVQLSRLLARIDAHEAERATSGGGFSGMSGMGVGQTLARPLLRFASVLDRTPRPMRRLLAGQLAAILALAAILGWHLRPPAPAPLPPPQHYEGLGTPLAVKAEPGTVLLNVVFTEDATAARIQKILTAVHGTIQDGPSEIGRYTVAVPAGPGADPIAAVVRHLEKQPEVSFASPVAGAEGG